MIYLQGSNAFHQGWLQAVLELPPIAAIPGDLENESWLLGYKTAKEAPKISAASAIPKMIELGQITVGLKEDMVISLSYPIKTQDVIDVAEAAISSNYALAQVMLRIAGEEKASQIASSQMELLQDVIVLLRRIKNLNPLERHE